MLNKMLLVVLLYASSGMLLAQDLLVRSETNALRAEQKVTVERIRQESTTKSVQVCKINIDSLRNKSFYLDLRPELRIQATRKKTERRSDTNYTWFGTSSFGSVILVVNGSNITGTIRGDKGLYKIQPIGEGLHAIIEVDESKFPPDDPSTGNKSPESDNLQDPLRSKRAVKARAIPTIQVLVAYTPSAESAQGDIASLIQLAIDETNVSYANSSIWLRLHLAGTHKVHYDETGRSFSMIVRQFAATGDGQMSEIHNLRVAYAADVAVLIVNQPALCGQAQTIQASSFSAFVIVHYSCATGYYSFGHEIGHLQGARHDLANDSNSTPYPFGHGYQNGSSWRTIMAYDCKPSCPRLQYWSNPQHQLQRKPDGHRSHQ
jgi:hypothetical protein